MYGSTRAHTVRPETEIQQFLREKGVGDCDVVNLLSIYQTNQSRALYELKSRYGYTPTAH